MWYPSNKQELNLLLEDYLSQKKKINKNTINGLIVPHAGYEYSGKISGKAFSLLKDKKIKKAIILAPSHYVTLKGIASIDKIQTPLGKINIIKNSYRKLEYEHAIDNQIPFLQKLGIKKILPLIIGEINQSELNYITKELINQLDNKTILIISTDLSHFFSYEQANKTDKNSIKIIKNLDIKVWKDIDACGIFPLLILMNICKIKKYKPKLLEYKNSGDITGDKSQVVGYASFWF